MTGTAGAGSLILEFGTLSRLTGDDRFEKAAYKAFFALWNQRSDIGLVGNTVNIFTGVWTMRLIQNITNLHPRHGHTQKLLTWEQESTHFMSTRLSGTF